MSSAMLYFQLHHQDELGNRGYCPQIHHCIQPVIHKRAG